jgi:hypothetical protein
MSEQPLFPFVEILPGIALNPNNVLTITRQGTLLTFLTASGGQLKQPCDSAEIADGIYQALVSFKFTKVEPNLSVGPDTIIDPCYPTTTKAVVYTGEE